MDTESKNIEIACPECGKDVCVLHDTKRPWTHRSRVIPRIVWAVVCLGLIGYWVSTGKVYSVHGQVNASWQNLGGVATGQASTSFEPEFGGTYDPESISFISRLDFQQAADGDEEALARVMAKLREAVVYNQSNHEDRPAIESVVFGWKESYGSSHSSISYYFVGGTVRLSSGKMVPDIRDLDTVGKHWFQGDWGDGGLTLFPTFGYRTIGHNGAVSQAWSISIIGLFGLLSVTWVLVWLVGFFGGFIGIKVAGRRSFRLGLIFILLTAVGITSYLGPRQFTSLQADAFDDIVQSKAYTIEELEAFTSDETQANELIEELLGLFAANPQGPQGLGYVGEELLAQEWSREFSAQSQPKTTNDRFDVWIGYGCPLINYDRLNYIDLQDGQEVTVLPHDSTWESFRKRGMLTLRWGPPEHRASLSIGMVIFISIGVLFWLIWKFNHWCARFVLGRVQKRRVIGNQCIFCAYPLTQEATQARYPQVAP